VPEISRFFGIVIAMFYNDHAPPHFHVRYGSARAIVAIGTLSVLEGGFAVTTRAWLGGGVGGAPPARASR
jgi:hypothetical protein